MRLDLAQPVGVEPAQAGHPVLAAAALELVEPGSSPSSRATISLPRRSNGIPRSSQYAYSSRAPSTQSRAFSDPGA